MAAGVGIGRLLRLPRVFVNPDTRWLACTRWGDIPAVVGDAWGGIIRGSSFSLISCVRSPTIFEVAPRSTSLISDRVRDLLEDLPDPLLLPPRDSGPLLNPLKGADPGAYPGAYPGTSI